MTATKHTDLSREVSARGPWAGRAWLAVALIPVFFLVAFALGYVMYDLFGYQPENDDAPFAVELICTIPVVVVSLLPCVAAIHFGRRSARIDDRRGLVPLAVGALAGLGVTILGIVGLVA